MGGEYVQPSTTASAMDGPAGKSARQNEMISAYIPAFNCGKTIERTIASLQSQTVAVSEIIVVDDGSTDDTAAVSLQAGARVIRMGANCGRGAARAGAM